MERGEQEESQGILVVHAIPLAWFPVMSLLLQPLPLLSAEIPKRHAASDQKTRSSQADSLDVIPAAALHQHHQLGLPSEPIPN